MARPLVSVIMPAYNAAPFVKAAIDSVLAQTYSNIELIVVDDGSTDGTGEIVQRYGSKLSYIYQRNSRQAAARNTGLWHAGGEVLAFIDADDIWLPEKLEKQVALLEQDPSLGLIYCSVKQIDEDGRVLGELRANLRGDALPGILLGQVVGGMSSTVVIPRWVLEWIGHFDVTLPPCEDTDMLWRAASCCPIDYVGEPLVLYRLHDNNSHQNVRAMAAAWKLLYRKALDNSRVRELGWRFRRQCYGRLYYMLAGDHAHNKLWASACYYAAYGAWFWPPILPKVIRHFGRRFF